MNEQSFHPVFSVVGPTQSGKSTLIKAVVAKSPEKFGIIRSITTRPPRDEDDAVFYDFVTREDFENRIKNGEMAQYTLYAGNYYGLPLSNARDIASSKIAITSTVQQGIDQLRSHGFTVAAIYVIPKGYVKPNDEARNETDYQREQHEVDYAKEIVNSREPGGLEKAVKELEDFIYDYLASHPNSL